MGKLSHDDVPQRIAHCRGEFRHVHKLVAAFNHNRRLLRTLRDRGTR